MGLPGRVYHSMAGKEPGFRELLISKWKITKVPEHSVAHGASPTDCTHHPCPSPTLYLSRLIPEDPALASASPGSL